MMKFDGFTGRLTSSCAVTGIVTTVLILLTGTVAAQEADTAVEKPRKSLVIEEVVVTARKKEENIQDVPIAMNAFNAEELERAGISNLTDVAAFTPGLTFSSLFGEFLPVPVIRGVAPTAIFGENNVAVFVDGVFVAGREGLNAGQLDLERIEVLKGPQSTKYGRNAFAGAINYVTKRPGDELEVEAKFNVGNYDKREARIAVSGPLVADKLSGRIAMGIDEWSGSYDNAISNVDIGGYQYKTLQSSLWFTPTDTLDVQWAVYLSDDEIDDSARSTVPANCEDREWIETGIPADQPFENDQLPAPAQVVDPVTGELIDNPDFSDGPRPQNYCGTLQSLPDNTLAVNDQATGEDRELTRSSLHIDWDLGWGSLTALTGFSKTNQTARSDSNQTPDGSIPFHYDLADPGFQNQILYAYQTTLSTGDDTTEWSQELRFSSPQDNPLRFDVGAYWYDVEAKGGFTHWTSTWVEDTGNGQILPDDFFDFYPGPSLIGGAIWGPQFLNSVNDPVGPPWPQPPWPADYDGDGVSVETIQQDTQSWSLFAGGEADLTERLTADFGVRYNHDDKKYKASISENIPPDPPDEDVAWKTPSDEKSYNYWTWRAGLKFDITDDNMAYISISNGKKSGGMDLLLGDIRFPDGVTTERVARWIEHDIEELTAYELGTKGKFWGGRAQFDVAIFYNDWDDILMPQILDNDPETGHPFEQPEGIDLTGGDATTYGIEASVFVILAENWDINVGGSWTDAEYDEAELSSLRLFPSMWNDTGGNGYDEPLPDGRGDAVSIEGNEMLRQSKWQGNFTLNYNKPIRNDWAFYSRTDVLYTGSQWVGPANQAKVPDYTDVNQRLGFENDNFRLEFWVENLFDDDTPRAAFRDVSFNNTHLQQAPYEGFSDMFPFRLTVSHPKRRTAGVSALIRF